jgi:hypothetical protein
MNKLLIAILLAFLFVVSKEGWAGVPQPPDGTCGVRICKDAEDDAGEIPFSFEAEQGGSTSDFTLFSESECIGVLFGPIDSVTITEGPTRGFVLDSVVCEGFSSPVVITEIDNGIIAECNSANDEGTCTFVNVRGLTSTAIPTLSEWGLISMAGIMGIIGFFVAMRRRRAKEVES